MGMLSTYTKPWDQTHPDKAEGWRLGRLSSCSKKPWSSRHVYDRPYKIIYCDEISVRLLLLLVREMSYTRKTAVIVWIKGLFLGRLCMKGLDYSFYSERARVREDVISFERVDFSPINYPQSRLPLTCQPPGSVHSRRNRV